MRDVAAYQTAAAQRVEAIAFDQEVLERIGNCGACQRGRPPACGKLGAAGAAIGAPRSVVHDVNHRLALHLRLKVGQPKTKPRRLDGEAALRIQAEEPDARSTAILRIVPVTNVGAQVAFGKASRS